MLKRLLVIVVLAALPLGAQADDLPVPEPTPEATPAATPTSGPDANAGLGPQTNNPGGSTGDAAALQPAGTSPLQSTPNDSNGLTAPTANSLQAPTTPNDTLQVLMGEADGATVDPNADESHWPLLWWTLGVAALVGALAFFLWRRQQRRLPAPAEPAPIERLEADQADSVEQPVTTEPPEAAPKTETPAKSKSAKNRHKRKRKH